MGLRMLTGEVTKFDFEMFLTEMLITNGWFSCKYAVLISTLFYSRFTSFQVSVHFLSV